MEPYQSFAVLLANETAGVDFRIRVRHGRSGLAVMAIHGGGIEPGTTEIAESIAGDMHTFYSFSGLKASGNACLHLTSRKFDEPSGLAIAKRSRTVITIHGCRDAKAITYLGGRDDLLRRKINKALTAGGFPVKAGLRFPGTNPKNICNKNRSGMGVQLEISIGMRKLLFEDVTRLHRKCITPTFVSYVHALQGPIKRI